MKKTLYFFVTILIIVSCNTKKDATNSPLFVMNEIKKAVEIGDTKTMTTHFCKKNASIINTFNTISILVAGNKGSFVVDLIKKKLTETHQLNFDNYEFKNEKINDNRATIESYNIKKEKTSTFDFVKEEGMWKLCL
jgi:hypothetical protein